MPPPGGITIFHSGVDGTTRGWAALCRQLTPLTRFPPAPGQLFHGREDVSQAVIRQLYNTAVRSIAFH